MDADPEIVANSWRGMAQSANTRSLIWWHVYPDHVPTADNPAEPWKFKCYSQPPLSSRMIFIPMIPIKIKMKIMKLPLFRVEGDVTR